MLTVWVPFPCVFLYPIERLALQRWYCSGMPANRQGRQSFSGAGQLRTGQGGWGRPKPLRYCFTVSLFWRVLSMCEQKIRW